MCECSDNQCPVHKNKSICTNEPSVILYRIDMDDITGTLFCEDCCNDAMESGLFTDE